jgi:hypothetical protein
MLALLASVALAVLEGVAIAAPSATELAAAWERWRTELDAGARHPLRFEAREWEEIARGHVAKRRDRLEGTDRVVGVIWVAADVDTTWLATRDPHGDDYVDGFVEEELPGSTAERRLVYQRYDLPRPLADRQWVIEVVNNVALIRATGGALIERSWTLTDARGARAETPSAVWLPVNEGGWFLAEAGGGTILGYHVRTSIGGIVPDEVALRWSFSTLDGMLEDIAAKTTFIRGHYTGSHAPLRRADGTEIPRFTP